MDFREFLKSKNYFKTLPRNIKDISSTTVVALKYKDGVVIGCDSQATETSTFNKLREPVKKIVVCDSHSAVGLAGAPALALRIARIFQVAISAEERMLESLSPEGKAQLLESIIEAYFSLVLETEGRFIAEVLFCSYDTKTDKPRLFVCDPSGFCPEVKNFTAIGSGGEAAQSRLDNVYKEDLTHDEAVNVLIDALKYSCSRNAACGPPYFVFEVAKTGVKEIKLKEEDKCST